MKKLGKIINAEFGKISDKKILMGLQLMFEFKTVSQHKKL